jgi:hypothetical protein
MAMIDDVTARLAAFNYTVVTGDAWMLGFIIDKVENHIKNQCNVTTVPVGLEEVAVDRATGEFLLGKKSSGQLTGFDVDDAIKTISEGDTSVTFGTTTEERMNALIAFLMHEGTDFSVYRCIKW